MCRINRRKGSILMLLAVAYCYDVIKTDETSPVAASLNEMLENVFSD